MALRRAGGQIYVALHSNDLTSVCSGMCTCRVVESPQGRRGRTAVTETDLTGIR
jgi:hypothetical protein